MAARYPIDGVRYHADAAARSYLDSGDWLDTNIGDAMRATATATPDKAGLIFDDTTVSLAEIDTKSESFAAALLDMGLQPGDRALFQIGSSIDLFFALLGCFKAGVVPVCGIPQYREREIRQLIDASEPKIYLVQSNAADKFDLRAFAEDMSAQSPTIETLIVTGDDTGDHLTIADLAGKYSADEARERTKTVSPYPQDVLAFQLSGGSTGVPKIIPRMHGEYLGWATAVAKRWELGGDDVSLWALQVIHNAGMLIILMPMVLQGRTVVLQSSFEATRFLEAIPRYGVTYAGSIGPIVPKILDVPNPRAFGLDTLHTVTCLAESQRLEQHLDVTCMLHFGMTEGMVMGSSPGASADARHKTLGRPVFDSDEVRILEVGGENEVPDGEPGEMCFRGPAVVQGYFRNDEANAESFTSDGFLRTGDLFRCVKIDGVSHYAFVGRSRDNINRGGEKYGAAEVEAVLAGHEAIADVQIVAMPDPYLGEKACAFVILASGAEAPGLDQIGAYLMSRGLAKFKLPERIKVVEAFPVTRVGKVDKVEMRRLIADEIKAEMDVTAGA